MEVALKKVIKKHDLQDSFYYLNVDSLKNESADLITELNSALKLEDKKITNVPTILYYQEHELKSIIKKNNGAMMQATDFEKLLRTLDVEE